MRRGRRTVLTRRESRAGGLRRVGMHVAISGLLLALILVAVAPHQGNALTIPSVSTSTVSVPTVSVPAVTVPTVSVPAVTVPTVTTPRLPTPTVPTPTIPTVSVPKPTLPVPTPTVSTPTAPRSLVPTVTSPSTSVRVPSGAGFEEAAAPSAATTPSASGTGASGDGISPAAISARPAAGDRARHAPSSQGQPRPRLSQRRLRKLVAQNQGCLSSLTPRQSTVLILRTGIGIKHAYSRQQVAKLLRLTLQQEGRLEQLAVTGLTNASTNGRCANPFASFGSAVHLAARAALSLFAGFTPSPTSTTTRSSGGLQASTAHPRRPAERPKSSAPPKSATGGTSPRIRSAAIASPQHGGIDWPLLALLLAVGATAVWLIFLRQRPQSATGAAETPARPRARFLHEGAGAVASAVGLVALRGAVAERRRHAQLPEPARAPVPDPGPQPTESLAHDDAGDRIAEAIAAFELGGVLAQNDDLAGAEAAFRHADQHGHPSAATNLGVLLERRGDLAGAEAACRRADERGDATGAFSLGGLLAARNDLAGAETAFRHADERGHASSASNLGVLLEERGDLVGAEAAYRRADERGDATGALNLGELLAERNDLPGAEAAYQRAYHRGHGEVSQMAEAALAHFHEHR